MKITAVRFGRTVSKDYQSRKAEIEISVGEGESNEDAMALAQLLVDEALGLRPVQNIDVLMAEAKLIGLKKDVSR